MIRPVRTKVKEQSVIWAKYRKFTTTVVFYTNMERKLKDYNAMLKHNYISTLINYCLKHSVKKTVPFKIVVAK